MSKLQTLTRRTFVTVSLSVVAGVAFGALAYRRPLANPLLDELKDGEAAITPYVLINENGITLITPRADVGQGAHDVQGALIAEELDVDLASVTLSPGMPDAAYYNALILEESAPYPAYDESGLAARARDAMKLPARLLGLQVTGGSSTVPDAYEKLRMAGAVARETLKEAAAQRTGVARASLTTKDGHVVLPDGEQIAYTSLARAAANIDAVTDVSLRPPAEWQLLGKPRQRADIVAKSTGTLIYGIDLVLPGMVYATVRTNPGLGGEMTSFDASAAGAMRGVLKVVPITSGIAVIADNTWRAMRAANAVDIDWGPVPYPAEQAELWDTLASAFGGDRDSRNKDEGDVESALTEFGATVVEAEYRVPYLAHAPLEPMNAVVKVSDDGVEVWTGTQIPRFVQSHVAKLVGVERDAVRVYVQPMGGSFGRRLDDTYVLQATEIAMAHKGAPVKMTWTREEDMAHDYPRPAQIARIRGAAQDGRVSAFDFATASQSVIASWLGRVLVAPPGPDITIVSGAWDQPLAIPNYRVTGYRAPEMVPVSSWRSVGNSGVGFLHGAALDELFAAAGADPMDELIRLCSYPLARNVLEKVKAISGWTGRTITDDRARGVAFTMSFGVPMAQVVEVSQTSRGIRIDRVFAACEVGTVLDPVNLEAQISGGIIFALGHAMNCELTYRNHAPEQTNFDAYQGIRMYQAPEIEVVALEYGDQVRGIGEPAVPPAAAALANAIFALTGQRIRELPLNKLVAFV